MGVLDSNLVVAAEQRWASPRLTRWFVGMYCAWILLGSVWSWYRHCDVNGTASARVVFTHSRSERVQAYGDVTIHQYIGDPRQVRFVGDTRLRITSEHPRILKLLLMFRHVNHDERMTVRLHPGAVADTAGLLFGHSVTTTIPLPAGEHDVELSFSQQDVQYVLSTVELLKNETGQKEIVTERSWLPFLERGGVQFGVGSGWFLPLPDLAGKRPFTDTGRQAYLLLTADEPGDYELVLPWMPTDTSYGKPLVLLDGKECSMEVTPGPDPASCAIIQFRLQKEHVLSVQLNDRIVSPLSRWQSCDGRFLGYRIPWNLLEMNRKR